MNAITRSVALTVVLLVAASTLAVGPVVADETACQGNGVVGVTQNGVLEDSVALYAGTEIRLGTCHNGSVQGFDASRLGNHDGYEVVENDGTDTPTIRITGAEYPINFSNLLDSTASQGLTVSKPAVTYHSQILDRTMTFTDAESAKKFQQREREYERSVDEFENVSKALGNITADVRSAPRLSADAEDSANVALGRLSTAHDEMAENADRLRNDALVGQSNGAAVSVGAAITNNLTATAETGNTAVENYRQAVATHRGAARSTILTYLGGPLLGGILVGAILGAVVPLKQARNVEEQLRLSRNVEYSPRVALIPTIVGIVFVIGGIIVLWYVGGLSLVGILL